MIAPKAVYKNSIFNPPPRLRCQFRRNQKATVTKQILTNIYILSPPADCGHTDCGGREKRKKE